MNYIIELKHISTINIGDTVLHENHLRTVSKNNVKRCSLMGLTLFGDSYKLGHDLVKKVTIIKSNNINKKL